MQRALDGVLPALVALDDIGARACARSVGHPGEVEVLADAQLEPQLVEHRTRRGWRGREQDVGVHEREIADEDRGAFTEASRFAPRLRLLRVVIDVRPVHRCVPPPRVGAVHDVVVHERERVQQLERGADVDDDGIVGIAPRAHERPVAERRPEPLAARADQIAQRGERLGHLGRDRGPAQDLAVEHREDAFIGAVADVDEARRQGHARRGRAQMHCRRW